jgi:hypothetical protein
MAVALLRLFFVVFVSGAILLSGCKPNPTSANLNAAPALASNEVIHGIGREPKEPTALMPGITLSFSWDAQAQRTKAQFSGPTPDGGEMTILDGEGIKPGDPYIYYWDTTAKTFWLATPRTLKRTHFASGVQGCTSWISTNTPEDPKCPRDFEIPRAFDQANQALLAKVRK